MNCNNDMFWIKVYKMEDIVYTFFIFFVTIGCRTNYLCRCSISQNKLQSIYATINKHIGSTFMFLGCNNYLVNTFYNDWLEGVRTSIFSTAWNLGSFFWKLVYILCIIYIKYHWLPNSGCLWLPHKYSDNFWVSGELWKKKIII